MRRPPASASGHPLAVLQREVGNRAVTDFLALQRAVVPAPAGGWYSDRDPALKVFTSKAAARTYDKQLKQSGLVARPPSSRKTKYAGGFASQMAAPRGGVTKSPDVTYPTKPIELLPAGMAKKAATHKRASMGKPMRGTILTSAESKPKKHRTAEDEAMLASPNQNMVTANISMNHKLADSSVAAICRVIVGRVQAVGGASNLPKPQLTALQRFIAAMVGGGPEAALAFDSLESAASASAGILEMHLKIGIDLLSMAWRNLRFGNAEVNTLILYAFDPNYDGSGMDTPLTGEIRASVRALGASGLIDAKIAAAATTEAIRKADGSPMSSSHI